ncbi:hypothetical protein NEOLEDRAFT_1134687 [Neolentinus lepideus HHB14362 ss-1]|uniref:Uncharacterized protein n=1 Tax=Neolentinus lepideus HHB14362 ss-1 TaxID=1314782 RepID=A0A165S459_9AGAM|nr:hypothetical protein NEOLEDRAFT_1134687 [Neolentinus lepideus HHB14362 ss-1]
MSSETACSPVPSSASEDAILMERTVRFGQECVLIPEPASKSRRPRLVMKSYSLPLWNRKSGSGSAVSDSEVDSNEDGLFLRVTVPKIITRSSSFIRDRSDEAPPSPLQSCLVRHEPGLPRSPRLIRQCTAPLPARPDLMTIPLRSCCPDCYPVTEESLKEGAEWKERFSRGARRRRNSSVSSDEGSLTRYGESVRHGSLHGRVLSVDEVDKRRRSSESGGVHKRGRGRDPAVSLNDERSRISRSPSSPDLGTNTASPPRSSPIMEENEDELFPLPSPRRSPQDSPTASTSCLSPKDDVDPTVRSELRAPSSNESISGALPKSQTMKKCEKGFLAPDPSLWLPSPTSESCPSPPSPVSPEPTTSTPPHPPASQPIAIPASFSRRDVSSPPALLEEESPESPKSSRSISPEKRVKRRSSVQLHMYIPGPASLLRAGAEVLKGVSLASGAPMCT